MKAVKYLAVVLAGIFLFVACQKEFSIESGDTATGTLKDEAGNCLPVTTNGMYVKDISLTEANHITVQVNFSAAGTYQISTDTSNGFSFHASGATKDAGLQSIRLVGTGKPVVAQPTNFTVSFDTSVCTFSVNVTDSSIAPPVTSGDYFPTTDNSNWSYSNNTTADTVLVKAEMTDRNLASFNYRIFSNDRGANGRDSSYFRKAGGSYHTYSNFNELGIYDTVEQKVDYIFLKDNEPVNSTWESPELDATHDSVAGKAKIRFTIEGKDVQTTIGATTFDSVINVKQEYLFAGSETGEFETVVSANFYYAKNIGFIKAEMTDPLPVTLYVTRWEIFY